jgi:hypothetical protein
MNSRLKMSAVAGLRWVLGLVLLLESAHFAISPAAGSQLTANGFPGWTVPALGGSEVVAALLFLVPSASMVGGYALLFIFLVAACVHFLHGQFGFGHLVVYSMAVIVCMTDRKNQASVVPHDR